MIGSIDASACARVNNRAESSIMSRRRLVRQWAPFRATGEKKPIFDRGSRNMHDFDGSLTKRHAKRADRSPCDRAPGTEFQFTDERRQVFEGSAGCCFVSERFFERGNNSWRWSTYRAGLPPVRIPITASPPRIALMRPRTRRAVSASWSRSAGEYARSSRCPCRARTHRR